MRLRRGESIELLLLGRRGHVHEDRQERVLHHQAGGFAAACLARCHSTWRCWREQIKPGRCEARGIEHRPVQ